MHVLLCSIQLQRISKHLKRKRQDWMVTYTVEETSSSRGGPTTPGRSTHVRAIDLILPSNFKRDTIEVCLNVSDSTLCIMTAKCLVWTGAVPN